MNKETDAIRARWERRESLGIGDAEIGHLLAALSKSEAELAMSQGFLREERTQNDVALAELARLKEQSNAHRDAQIKAESLLEKCATALEDIATGYGGIGSEETIAECGDYTFEDGVSELRKCAEEALALIPAGKEKI